MFFEFLPLFITLVGFVIGLGAVTVIDILGFLGRHSGYWTEATIRTHKVTKPLIWLGIGLVSVGGVWRREADDGLLFLWQGGLILLLIANGLFLTFWVSPRLLERERAGRSTELLPLAWQRVIALSFGISLIGWWGSLLLFMLSIQGM